MEKIIQRIVLALSYICRAFLAYVFIPHGYEKLTEKISQQEYIDFGLGGDFLDFYLIWERTNFIHVIGFAQLVGGLLLLFRRTYFFGAVWLFPVSLGMFLTHVYISHALDFIYFDLLVLLFNAYLILENYAAIRAVFFKSQKTWI